MTGATHGHVVKQRFLQTLHDSTDIVGIQETRGVAACLESVSGSHSFGFRAFLGECSGTHHGCACAGACGIADVSEELLAHHRCCSPQTCMDDVGQTVLPTLTGGTDPAVARIPDPDGGRGRGLPTLPLRRMRPSTACSMSYLRHTPNFINMSALGAVTEGVGRRCGVQQIGSS